MSISFISYHDRARHLDDQAGLHLAAGRHDLAEKLSNKAAELREPSTFVRFQRGAEHLHRLGARAQAELLLEIGRTFGCTDQIGDLLDQWRALDPSVLRAVGGDRFPPLLAEVPK